jgi:two-component system phosphate regulon response regulator PhoB
MSKADKSDTKRSILIVEDSTDFSNLMKFIVEDDGFEGLQFPLEHEDIVGWVKEHKPATILMDLALRRKGGMQYIEELKADPATKNVPIIIITGRELNPKEVLSLQIRGVKYLRKGRIEMEEIRNTIRESAMSKKPATAAAKTKQP